MIKDTNARLTITISKKQKYWLERTCRKNGITVSKFVCWVLSKKSQDIVALIKIKSKQEADLYSIAQDRSWCEEEEDED